VALSDQQSRVTLSERGESKDLRLPFVPYQGLAGRPGIHPDIRNPPAHFLKNQVRGEAAHIAFQLATMALEEIGNSSMIFIDAIDHKAVGGDEETKTPINRIDDHERKHFGRVTPNLLQLADSSSQ